MFGFSKTRLSPEVEKLTKDRLNFWKMNYDWEVLDKYEDKEFLELITRRGTYRIYGTNPSNYKVYER